jgi:dCMP deaminase
MNKINPHKTKYFNLYMRMAIEASKESVATRRQVGAVIVLPDGMISLGWNGTPPGSDNRCEYIEVKPNSTLYEKTKPDVIHAERNALDKITISTMSSEGALLFINTAPCLNCALSVANVGIKEVIYLEDYKNTEGLDHLLSRGIKVQKWEM